MNDMKYGQLPKSKYSEKNGVKINEWIEVDMSPKNLRSHGLRSKRGWDGKIEFKVTHLFDDYFIGLTGSLDNMCIPYSLVVKH